MPLLSSLSRLVVCDRYPTNRRLENLRARFGPTVMNGHLVADDGRLGDRFFFSTRGHVLDVAPSVERFVSFHTMCPSPLFFAPESSMCRPSYPSAILTTKTPQAVAGPRTRRSTTTAVSLVVDSLCEKCTRPIRGWSRIISPRSVRFGNLVPTFAFCF